jgi:carbon monoxide dehydrogenase subunit G
MNFSGTANMHASADQVWAALHDPVVLAAAIPGCERLEAAGPDRYRFTLSAGIASIQGTYAGDIELSQQHEPSSFVLSATGAGGPGVVSTTVRIRLAAAGDYTELSYDADAEVTGLIAGLGQLMLSSVARRLVDEFFAGVDDVLSGNVAAEPASATGGPSAADEASGAASPVTRTVVVPSGPAFAGGVVVGAAVTLAGVAVRGLFGRKARSDDG